jgi:PKD repeat protein
MAADFSGTPTAGFVPFTVQFTDTSTGSPIAWSWDFGDGGTSTLMNPPHTYTSVQSYTVSLTVHNGTGISSVIKSGYITTYYPPFIVAFTSNVTSGFRPLAVQFTDQSSDHPSHGCGTLVTGERPSPRTPPIRTKAMGDIL